MFIPSYLPLNESDEDEKWGLYSFLRDNRLRLPCSRLCCFAGKLLKTVTRDSPSVFRF